MSAPDESPELPGLRGNRFRDTWAGGIDGARVGSEVRLAGWVSVSCRAFR